MPTTPKKTFGMRPRPYDSPIRGSPGGRPPTRSEISHCPQTPSPRRTAKSINTSSSQGHRVGVRNGRSPSPIRRPGVTPRKRKSPLNSVMEETDSAVESSGPIPDEEQIYIKELARLGSLGKLQTLRQALVEVRASGGSMAYDEDYESDENDENESDENDEQLWEREVEVVEAECHFQTQIRHERPRQMSTERRTQRAEEGHRDELTEKKRRLMEDEDRPPADERVRPKLERSAEPEAHWREEEVHVKAESKRVLTGADEETRKAEELRERAERQQEERLREVHLSPQQKAQAKAHREAIRLRHEAELQADREVFVQRKEEMRRIIEQLETSFAERIARIADMQRMEEAFESLVRARLEEIAFYANHPQNPLVEFYLRQVREAAQREAGAEQAKQRPPEDSYRGCAYGSYVSMREPSMDVLMREPSTDALMRERSTDAWMRDPSTDALMRERSTDAWMRDPSTDALMRERSTDALMRERSTDDLMREPSMIDDFMREPSVNVSMYSIRDDTPLAYDDEPPRTYAADPPPRPLTDADRFAIWEQRWEAIDFFPKLSGVTFRHLPWPVLHDVESIDDIAPEYIRHFLEHPQCPSLLSAKKLLPYYHPDKFNVRVLSKMDPEHREEAKEIADQCLILLLKIRRPNSARRSNLAQT